MQHGLVYIGLLEHRSPQNLDCADMGICLGKEQVKQETDQQTKHEDNKQCEQDDNLQTKPEDNQEIKPEDNQPAKQETSQQTNEDNQRAKQGDVQETEPQAKPEVNQQASKEEPKQEEPGYVAYQANVNEINQLAQFSRRNIVGSLLPTISETQHHQNQTWRHR
jgi:hypothetical protein